MGDLFGDWVPDSWITAILEVVRACRDHTFQFLTGRPDRYADFNPCPANAWLGATVTNQLSLDRSQDALAKADARVRFLSAEPLHGFMAGLSSAIDWLIIGYETGPGLHPHPPDDHVSHLVDEAHRLDIPVWLKASITARCDAEGSHRTDSPLKEWPRPREASCSNSPPSPLLTGSSPRTCTAAGSEPPTS
jgi:protein gp37